MSKLLDDVRNVMRVRHYSYQTEKIYIYWIRQYIYFHKITHPAEMGALRLAKCQRRWFWAFAFDASLPVTNLWVNRNSVEKHICKSPMCNQIMAVSATHNQKPNFVF
jgi:hypothetical protein